MVHLLVHILFFVGFLKGVRRLRPARNPHFPGWDLPLVLVCFHHSSLCKQLTIRGYLWKKLILLGITSAKLVSELHALPVSELCTHWLPDDSGVVLWPNQSFLLEVLLPQFASQSVNLAAFQSASQSDQWWCPEKGHYINAKTIKDCGGNDYGIQERPKASARRYLLSFH